MLGDAGSIASLAGVVVSLLGLSFAIWQLARLRGETKASREASEATRRALGRDLAIADVSRLNERLQRLKEIHREGNRQRALDSYPEVVELISDIRHRHPSLPLENRANLLRTISDISDIEATVESLDQQIGIELARNFNRTLTDFQITLLPELEDLLEES